MNDELLLPPRLTLLGEALRPVWFRLCREIDRFSQPSTLVGNMKEIIPRHMSALAMTINRLETQLNRLTGDVVANDAATDSDVYRAVGGFEAVLDDILAGYQAVRTLDAQGYDKQARDLLAGVYRHTLDEVRVWLLELVETLADPMATVIKRGLPSSGNVELPLVLTLTGAPQLPELAQWAKRHAASLTTSTPSARYQPPPRRRSGLGFWGTVGAVALGWGIGEALFGDDDCDV